MAITLIAIAALAATGAFAQSTVTMSGVVDMAYMNGSQQNANVDTKMSSFERNGSSTSALNIAGVEDLGGGMKASFFFESNWSPAAGAASTFANGQTFLGLEGGFGKVRLGAANSAVLETALAGDAFGTAVGGSYTGRFSRTGQTVGTAANGAYHQAGGRIIRNANSVRYDTPAMGAFSASYELAFANKNAASTSYTTAGANVLGLRYAAGPLTVAFANASTTAVGTVLADAKTTQNLLSANYVMGATTVYGGYTTFKATDNTGTTDNTSSLNFAVKYQVSGAMSVMASMAKRSDKVTRATEAQNGSLIGLGFDYAMSKRTTGFGRYETIDSNKADGANGKSNLLALGIKHTF